MDLGRFTTAAGLTGDLFQKTSTVESRIAEKNFLKTLHTVSIAALLVNVIYQSTTSREDDVSLQYHVYGQRPYFDGHEPRSPPEWNEDTGEKIETNLKYSLNTLEYETDGIHFDLPMWLLAAEIIGILYHLMCLAKLIMLTGENIDTGGDYGSKSKFGALQFKMDSTEENSEEGIARRETARLFTRQARAIYNVIVLGITQLTIMLVLAVTDEWLYLFVFSAHVAYHFAILTVDKSQSAPKSWLGGCLVVVVLFFANSWFFYEMSRIEGTTLYRPPLGDERDLPTCACVDLTGVTLSSCYVDAATSFGPLLPLTETQVAADGKKYPLIDPPLAIPTQATSGDCFDVFGETIPSMENLDYLIVAHILINGLYAAHLLFTKWPRWMFYHEFTVNSHFDPRELWGVSQDLGYVVLDFMYMGAVPAGVYTIHRELSRAVKPHQAVDDRDEFDWETFQVAYFYVALGLGGLLLLAIRSRFRVNVIQRQRVRDARSGPVAEREAYFQKGPSYEDAALIEQNSMINAKMIHGMSKGEMVPMLGSGYA